jgi:hypothetical protein
MFGWQPDIKRWSRSELIAMIDETWFASRSSWADVGEIPSFSFGDWESIKAALASGEYEMLVDYTSANALGRLLSRRLAVVFEVLAHSVPLLGIIVSVGLTFWTHNLFLLLGVVVAITGMLTGSPIAHKTCGCLAFGWCVSLALCALSVLRHMWIPAYLFGLYVVVVWCIGAYYQHNANELREAAMCSEPVFLYALEHGAIMLKEKHSGQIWSYGKQ